MGSVLRHSLGTTSIFYTQVIEILSFFTQARFNQYFEELWHSCYYISERLTLIYVRSFYVVVKRTQAYLFLLAIRFPFSYFFSHYWRHLCS